jgi:predicted nucleic acid-binding Zn ribbon protein
VSGGIGLALRWKQGTYPKGKLFKITIEEIHEDSIEGKTNINRPRTKYEPYKPIENCIACNKKITFKENTYSKYCSDECADNNYDRTKHRERMRSFRTKGILLKERDNKCQHCGSYANLDIHHIKYGNKPEDVLLLCHRCHMKEHAKLRNSK